MSRLAKKNIPVPQGVTVRIDNNRFYVEGPLGKLQQDFLNQYIIMKVENNEVIVERKFDAKNVRALQGLYWVLMRNLIAGVSTGFTRTLEIRGIGYKWEVQGSNLVITAGYSHPVKFPIPQGVKMVTDGITLLNVSGIDKQLVGQVSANIRFVRPPEPYKGKGIRYKDEVVRLKEGKAGAKK
ncbi:MAG: 50S ribosomal protein L6 [Spirochaetes bacterium GWF1_51_8]|nr:MAG: 50S ribosomal protein L6 [Spirochaetes bacterium GWF1_51_8]